MKLINRLERRLLRLRVEPFFRYIIFAMGGIFVLQWLFPGFGLLARMALSRPQVMSGQVWRLFTFLVIPPGTDILSAALSLYFFYFIGTALESRWGSRRFLIYYLFGVLGAWIGAAVSGFGTNLYLNMSMFFAFALLNQDFQVLLFFMVPVRMKWLALANAFFFLASFTRGSWPERAAILFSFLNLFLFFGGELWQMAGLSLRQWRRRRDFRKKQGR